MSTFEELLNDMKDKYKLALFTVIRDYKIVPLTEETNKSDKEINKTTYETMLDLLANIDYVKARERYNEGRAEWR